MARRLSCLQDFSAEGVDAMVECGNPNCRRRLRIHPGKLLDHIRKERWIFILRVQAEHLRCGVCGHKGKARIAPVPRIYEATECPEFKEDVRELRRRVWLRSLGREEKAG
jgi:hypothetical protein